MCNSLLLLDVPDVPYKLVGRADDFSYPDQVGFPSRDLHKLQLALDNTHAVLWIRSTKQSRWAKIGQLLGFARAFSDKALTATIWDVAVGLET